GGHDRGSHGPIVLKRADWAFAVTTQLALPVPLARSSSTTSGLHRTHHEPKNALTPWTPSRQWRGTIPMAQTDARAGFRLPWSSERSNIEQAETDQVDNGASDAAAGWPTTGATSEWGTTATDSAPAQTPSPSPRKPSKFLADLTKAMQTAAEEERNKNLTQFQADAKTYVEQIHERSATEANTLRRQADDDVAAVREWSKAEIARIREETESRITARKGRLETEIEQHGAMIAREIELVQVRVAGFEDEMASFF